MPRRRNSRVANMLSGLGVGIGNMGHMMFQQMMQERANQNILNRQIQDDTRKAVNDVLSSLRKGDIDAEQAAMDLSARTGRQVDASELEALRPSAPKRLSKRFDPEIASATSAETLPTEESILGFAQSDSMSSPGRIGFQLPESGDFEQMTEDPMGSFDPAVRQKMTEVGARRKRFDEAPTQQVTRKLADGSEVVEFVSRRSGPIRKSLSAEEEGRLKGLGTVAEIGAAGGAVADQAGRVASATTGASEDAKMTPGRVSRRVGEAASTTGAVEDAKMTPSRVEARVGEAAARTGAEQDVRMAPGAVNARVDEAERTSRASERGTINARLENAKRLIDFETQKALAELELVAPREEYKAWGEQVAKARESAQSALPMLGQLRDLWEKAQPQIEAMANQVPGGMREIALQINQGTRPRSTLPTAVRQYVDLLEAARPVLARSMRNVGNFTEAEQERAGYVAPDFIDAVNGGVTGTNKLDRIEALFKAAPVIAKENKPGTMLTSDQVDAIVKRYMPTGDIELPKDDYEILVTPSGLQTPRRPGGF